MVEKSRDINSGDLRRVQLDLDLKMDFFASQVSTMKQEIQRNTKNFLAEDIFGDICEPLR